MAISITPSPFGSVTVTLDGELGGVLSVGVLATSNSSLDMAIGVPGPAGATGSQGPAGTNGTNGVGVPVGGTTGQVLAKIDGTNYNTEWVDAGAAGDFLPLSGGTMSGAILFDAVGGQNISKGSFDSGRGGYNGISLNCANLYELNWQSGYLKNVYNGGVAPINVESDFIFPVDVNGNDSAIGPWGFGVENLDAEQSASIEPNQISITIDGVGTAITSTGVTFPDTSVQTTAGLPLTGGTVTGNLTIEYNDIVLALYPEGLSCFGDTYGWNLNGTTGLSFNDYEYTRYKGEKIIFSDQTEQTTAFPPSGGLVTEYITGTGSLVTFPPLGDRYLTSSTSTLTCDSGNGKTMTVGTGLSYSRQQDITVSYNTANHMHGTVLTYNSTTGVMTFDSNTHSGSGTYSSWEVNVGGVAGAILPVGGTSGQVLAKVNSTNFNTEWVSLGTMSTESASAYLSTASAVANYQTIAGMSAYLSTSAASSIYLTQSNASSTYLTQSNASTTYIGTSAYATTAQAEAMTSTATVLSPARFRDAYFTANVTKPNTSTWLTGTSGTGGLNDSGTWDFRRLEGPTSAANTYVRCDHGTNFGKGRNYNGNIDWSKYNAFYFRITQYGGADANSIFRAVLGEPQGTSTGDPTVRSVGIKFNGTGAIKILAHNGTTLTTYTTSTSLTTSSATDILIVSDGSGTVEVFANGTSIGTTTGGPTTLLAGTATQSCICYRIENNNTPSGTQVRAIMAGTTAYLS